MTSIRPHRITPGRLSAEIRITGPLAKLWGFMVGRKHADGLPALSARLIERAGAE